MRKFLLITSAAAAIAACNQPSERAEPVTEEVPVETTGTDTEPVMAEDTALEDAGTADAQDELTGEAADADIGKDKTADTE